MDVQMDASWSETQRIVGKSPKSNFARTVDIGHGCEMKELVLCMPEAEEYIPALYCVTWKTDSCECPLRMELSWPNLFALLGVDSVTTLRSDWLYRDDS